MTPRHIRHRNQILADALRLLEKDEQKYAAAEFTMHHRVTELSDSLQAAPARSAQLLEIVLQVLEIRAEAYVGLVTNLESQKAFVIVLSEFAIRAREGYEGLSRQFFSGLERIRDIDACVDHWIAESFRRIAFPGNNDVGSGNQLDSPSTQPSEVLDQTEEVERRLQLLDDYKAATGRPSNRSIYTARNSGIHKPQFHEWLRGELLNTSQTCINFERFLREKKRPIPREAD
jgi:hypothetical protein